MRLSRIPVGFIRLALPAVLGAAAIAGPAGAANGAAADRDTILAPAVAAAAAVQGLSFSEQQIQLMLPDLQEQRSAYRQLRSLSLPNALMPALRFDPRPAGWGIQVATGEPRWSEVEAVTRPGDLEEVAFWPIGRLSALLRSGQVTSTELTRMYLDRLQRFGSQLECVISLTEDIALQEAAQADAELAAGQWRGPLHGIPYGVKDLFAVAGTRTTWGAAPYREQVIDDTATVVRRLHAAGAVLVAKLTLGALAWGDVWYGGKTRNPWNLEQGSSGSSAGPAAAVAAGLVPFALGTETWGSIVSPCLRVGTTGLRPTFGRVSRAGAMALSWSMDKVGPIARRVEDCAIVLAAIEGPDGRDPTLIEAPFAYAPRDSLVGLRIGYPSAAFTPEPAQSGTDEGEADEEARAEQRRLIALWQGVLGVLEGLGAQLVPCHLPKPEADLSLILSAEAAAAFDELTRSGRDSLLVRQERQAWPNVFRAARFIPAVEYIQANRARTSLMREMAALMDTLDLYVVPPYYGDNLLVTNLTGHPCVVLPCGFVAPDQPTAITFVGDLFDEATLLAAARAYQQATPYDRQHPPGF